MTIAHLPVTALFLLSYLSFALAHGSSDHGKASWAYQSEIYNESLNISATFYFVGFEAHKETSVYLTVKSFPTDSKLQKIDYGLYESSVRAPGDCGSAGDVLNPANSTQPPKVGDLLTFKVGDLSSKWGSIRKDMAGKTYLYNDPTISRDLFVIGENSVEKVRSLVAKDSDSAFVSCYNTRALSELNQWTPPEPTSGKETEPFDVAQQVSQPSGAEELVKMGLGFITAIVAAMIF